MSSPTFRARALPGVFLLSLGLLVAVPLADAAPSRGPISTTRAAVEVTRGAPDHLVAAALRQTAVRRAPGYTIGRSVAGQTPKGFQVWVNPRAPHRAAIAKGAAAAVRTLRALGLNVHWRGYGTPRAAEGIIRISEGRSGCVPGTRVVGMTWPYWQHLPGGKVYVYRAEIALCPTLFRQYSAGAWRAAVQHELGHAMGLQHTNYRYLGSYQVMNSVLRSGVTNYRAGDRRGLQVLAADTRRLKTQLPPIGHFDNSSWSAATRSIRFTGWALLRFAPSSAVTVTLTDNGKTVLTSGTPVKRPDVSRIYDRSGRSHGFALSVGWRGGVHTYCVTARSRSHPAASVRLGCVTWRG